MAGARFMIDVDDAEVRRAFETVAARGEDLLPAMKTIGSYLVDSHRNRFMAGVDPEGKPWQPHSAATRRRRGPGAPILREMGMAGGLMGSITFQASPTEVVVGTNKKHGAIHQFGGEIEIHPRSQPVYQRINRGGELEPRFVRKSRSNFMRYVTIGAHKIRIPARPYLGVSAADRTEIVGTLIDHLDPEGGNAR